MMVYIKTCAKLHEGRLNWRSRYEDGTVYFRGFFSFNLTCLTECTTVLRQSLLGRDCKGVVLQLTDYKAYNGYFKDEGLVPHRPGLWVRRSTRRGCDAMECPCLKLQRREFGKIFFLEPENGMNCLELFEYECRFGSVL